MKTPMKYAAITAALLLASTMSVAAMSDADFKQAILAEIQAEENLSPAEIASIKTELDDISRNDILDSLKEEISELQDSELQKQLQADFTTLEKVNNGSVFFLQIDRIYETLDTYYEENDLWEDADFEYDFSEEKVYILEELKEEKKYISDADLINEVDSTITTLQNTDDEDVFFDSLDALYEKIDSYYGIEEDDWEDADFEYDFSEEKVYILEELKEEKKYISDADLINEVDIKIAEIQNIDDEDIFFESLDAVYEKIDTYYEAQGIDVIDGDEFFSDDFDFATEKTEIITELEQEIAELDNTELKNQAQADLEKLKNIDDEDAFFELLDSSYEALDSYYEESGLWDDEEQWEEVDDFDDEDMEDEDDNEDDDDTEQ